MSDTQIRETLARLKAALDKQPDIDPELAGLLRSLEADIEQALASAAGRSEGAEPTAGDLSDQVQSLAARFAVAHPNIDLVLRELRSLLLGIGL